MKNFPDPVIYSELKARQKENFNFQKVSSKLADHGFMTLRVSSDWESADFIAQHIDGITFIKVQLKGRFTIDRKYAGKDLYICFPDRPWDSSFDLDGDKRAWYLCQHDLLMSEALRVTSIGSRPGWLAGVAHAEKPPKELNPFLADFRL